MDLRNVVAGDPSPTGSGTLTIRRGIEVGHIFQLGTKYSESMKASVLDESGKPVLMPMGCYGIGITRIVAAAIEQNHDAAGIAWPEPLAPFQVVLVPLNMPKSERVRELAERLYAELTAAGIEVLFDDRDARPGVKFADAELLGIPHRLVVAERGIEAGTPRIPPAARHRQRRLAAGRRAPRACARGSACWLTRAPRCAAHARFTPWPVALLLTGGAGRARADQQRDPELRAIVERAVTEAACFPDEYEAEVWYKMMEPRLRRTVKDRDERILILKQVFCEAHRAGETRLPPGLVMAIIDVESRFNRWAVSNAGAVGLMQVMPFWPEQLGMRRYQLVRGRRKTSAWARRSSASTSSVSATTWRRRWRATTAASDAAGIPTW